MNNKVHKMVMGVIASVLLIASVVMASPNIAAAGCGGCGGGGGGTFSSPTLLK